MLNSSAFGRCEDALTFLDIEDVDLVILDVLLHGRNSLEQANKIVLGPCHPAVMVLAAVNDSETQEQAMLAGVEAFVSKDINVDHLITLVKTLLVKL